MDMRDTKSFCIRKTLIVFLSGLQDTINHVKDSLMPDYDYDEFTRRQEEWEERKAQEAAEEEAKDNSDDSDDSDDSDSSEEENKASADVQSEEDMSW